MTKHYLNYLLFLTFSILITYIPNSLALDVNDSTKNVENIIPNCVKSKTLSKTELTSWVNKIESSYRKMSSISADFKQYSYLASLDISEESIGKMWFANPGKLLWQYSKPEEQYFLIVGEEFQLYQPLDNQLIKQNVYSYFNSDLPVAFLLGIGKLNESFTPTSGCTNKNQVVLSLLPKSSKQATKIDGSKTKQVKIVIEQNGDIVGLEIRDSEGNITSFLLEERKLNQVFNDSVFSLNLPKGVDIQDNRAAN